MTNLLSSLLIGYILIMVFQLQFIDEKHHTGLFQAPEVSFYEVINAMTTAYSEFDSCHTGESCLMASGIKAYVGAVACPREIRLGTRVIIDNTPYICEDRTSIKYNGRYDIFMGYGEDAYNKAIQYGIRKKEVKIKESSLE